MARQAFNSSTTSSPDGNTALEVELQTPEQGLQAALKDSLDALDSTKKLKLVLED